MPFAKGYKKGAKTGGKVKGSKHKSTLIREKILNLDDFKEPLMDVWNEFLYSEDKDDRKFASKEIPKYVFPQKRELSGSFNGTMIINTNPKIGQPVISENSNNAIEEKPPELLPE